MHPPATRGQTYGLDNSVQAAARAVVAPMLAAGITAWVGYRGVFVGAAVIYVVAAGVALLVTRRALPPIQGKLPIFPRS